MIYDFERYKDYLLNRIKDGSLGKRGGIARLATAAQMQASNLSAVLHDSDRHLTLEQADEMNVALGHSEREGEYFLLLLLQERAGTPKLKAQWKKKAAELRAQELELGKRLSVDAKIQGADQAVFYSSWIYSAVQLLSALPKQTPSSIARKLGVPLRQVQKVVRFLLETGLCKTQADGTLAPGTRHTHLESTSPLVSKHHANWRIKAIERQSLMEPDELSYSVQVTLSREDADRIKSILIQAIEGARKIVDPSPSECAYFFNLDWLRLDQAE